MDASNPKVVRTEDRVGPNGDKHALIVDRFRELHIGAKAEECRQCVQAKRAATED